MDSFCFLVCRRGVEVSVEKYLSPSPEEANQGKMSWGNAHINLSWITGLLQGVTNHIVVTHLGL